jgi:hypothetical protein
MCSDILFLLFFSSEICSWVCNPENCIKEDIGVEILESCSVETWNDLWLCWYRWLESWGDMDFRYRLSCIQNLSFVNDGFSLYWCSEDFRR